MTQQQSSNNVLDEKIALVSINVGLFSGYRRATREQIRELGGELPNSAAVTEGSIKVFPNEALKTFHSDRRAVFREVAAKGIKALGSRTVFAVPKDALPEIEQLLKDAEDKHKQDVTDLEARYEDLFEQHVAANPEAAQIIRNLKVPCQFAIARMHFGHNIFSISPVVKEGEDKEKGVESIVASLARQLYEEVAGEMGTLAESDSLTGGIKASQRTLRPIKAQLNKMRGLSFLSPSVEHAVRFIEDVLALLPSEGYIEDNPTARPFTTLRRLVETLSEPDGILNAAGKTANGTSAVDILFPPKPQPVQAAHPAAMPVTPPQATAASAKAPMPAISRPAVSIPTMPLPRLPVTPAAIKRPVTPVLI